MTGCALQTPPAVLRRAGRKGTLRAFAVVARSDPDPEVADHFCVHGADSKIHQRSSPVAAQAAYVQPNVKPAAVLRGIRRAPAAVAQHHGSTGWGAIVHSRSRKVRPCRRSAPARSGSDN